MTEGWRTGTSQLVWRLRGKRQFEDAEIVVEAGVESDDAEALYERAMKLNACGWGDEHEQRREYLARAADLGHPAAKALRGDFFGEDAEDVPDDDDDNGSDPYLCATRVFMRRVLPDLKPMDLAVEAFTSGDPHALVSAWRDVNASDWVLGRHMLNWAASLNHPTACWLNGKMASQPESAKECFERATAQGHRVAHLERARLCFDPRYGAQVYNPRQGACSMLTALGTYRDAEAVQWIGQRVDATLGDARPADEELSELYIYGRAYAHPRARLVYETVTEAARQSVTALLFALKTATRMRDWQQQLVGRMLWETREPAANIWYHQVLEVPLPPLEMRSGLKRRRR